MLSSVHEDVLPIPTRVEKGWSRTDLTTPELHPVLDLWDRGGITSVEGTMYFLLNCDTTGAEIH